VLPGGEQERFLDQLARDLVADLLAEHPLEHRARHLARTKATHLRLFPQRAVGAVELLADGVPRDLDGQLLFHGGHVFDVDLHGHGRRSLTRKGTPW
jgi:hypothetical protein